MTRFAYILTPNAMYSSFVNRGVALGADRNQFINVDAEVDGEDEEDTERAR